MTTVSATPPTAYPPTRSQRAPWALLLRAFATGMVLLAAGLLVMYAVFGVRRVLRPSFGVGLTYTLTVDQSVPFSGARWAGLEAGMRADDQVLALDGVPLPDNTMAATAFIDQVLGQRNPGDPLRITFERAVGPGVPLEGPAVTCGAPQNGVATCEANVILARFPASDAVGYFVLPFSAGVVSLLSAAALLWLRPNTPMVLLGAMVCAALAVFLGGTFNVSTTHMLLPLWSMMTAMVGGLGVCFALVFPTPSRLVARAPWLAALPVVTGFGLGVAASWAYVFGAGAWTYPLIWWVPVLTAVAAQFALLAISAVRRRAMPSALMREQSNALFLGTAVAVVPVVLWVLSQTLNNVLGPQWPLFNGGNTLPFLVAVPLSMAYAVLLRPHNTDTLLTQTVTYAAIFVAVTLGYFLLTFGLSLAAIERVPANNVWAMAIVLFALAVALLPLRSRLQRLVDQLYYRERRDYATRLDAYSDRLPLLDEEDALVRALQDELEAALSPQALYTFVPVRGGTAYAAEGTGVQFEADSPLESYLRTQAEPVRLGAGAWPPALVSERARLALLAPNVLLPLRGSEQTLMGFVVLGAPRSGLAEYPYEMLRHMASVAGPTSVALERAQLVRSLTQRVRELDVFSQVSAGLNFATQADDLLELLSAQTSKLVEVSHVYVALLETLVADAPSLSFAFFQEHFERDRSQELLRWPLGADLFSVVAQRGAPVRVPHYAQDVVARGVSIPPLDPELHAFMAVPLVSGPTLLGVMAVGTTRENVSFDDTALGRLTDLAQLAASSLDKRRLYDRESVRARQLAALNEVSRQLASERDVERLLHQITASAVDIFNAEAGSLLLMADDGSGDLEFRVAVGGGGQQLVGTRLPAGHGLVGAVARSGQPDVVNDTALDERWRGEVAPDTSFRTRALLAVPLIAENRVIGVLEMVNKRDRTPYTRDDAALLASFGAQAAVALDNARLFRMTSEQLQMRVGELETLERIDSELNRTLDVHRVADITVRYAVLACGADAGALGLLEGEPPQLRLLSQMGYGAPDEAVNDLWPAEGNILGRVLRTRKPDLAPDLSIDPDHGLLLPGATSQLTLPMFSGREVVALLVVQKRATPTLSLADLVFTQRLAEHAAIAINNARLYGALVRANESKSEFMGIAAHELKTPLSSIMGYADLLRGGMMGEVSTQQQEFLNVIRSNAVRMQTIIGDLRDLAAMESSRLKVTLNPLALSDVVRETLRPLARNFADKGQTLIQAVPDDLPRVLGDEARLVQVMTNFVSNANKYSPPGATVTIAAEVWAQVREAARGLFGDYVHVSVADTGIGMSETDLARLFTPYFRSDNPLAQEQPGTGLGMAITQHLIQQHHGQVWVESALGMGTTFHFVLPLAPEAMPGD